MKPSSALSVIAAGVTAAAAVVILGPPASAATTWNQTQNVSDTFARTLSSGWGTATQGGAWSTTTSSLFAVASHMGRINAPAPGATLVQKLVSVHAADELARVTFLLPTLPGSTSGEYVTLRTRVQADGSALLAQARILNTGVMTVSLQQLNGPATTALVTGAATPYKVVAGQKINLDLQTTGAAPSTSVTARAYPATATPPAWQATATATKPSIAGGLAVSLHTSSASTSRTVVPAEVTAVSGWALTQTPTTQPPAQPGPTNTGVPAGTQLTVHTGDLNITTPGTVISGLDIHGSVTISAPNVVLKNSIVRGGTTLPTHGHCIVEDNGKGNGLNFLIEDTELAPTNVNYYQNDICGGNFTALRINSHSGVDTMDIAGSNVTLKDSWLHDTTHFDYSPEHNNGTHNDGIEITVGSNINISHNVIRGGGNSAIQITQDQGVTTGLTIANNWFDGGTCSLHINDKPLTSMSHIAITGSVFTPNSTIAHCAAVITHAVTYTWTGNTWTSGSIATPIVYG
jgi:hypothetical protein